MEDSVLTYAAALAFYTSLSLPPLIVLLVWALSHVGPDAQEFLKTEAAALMGDDGASLIDSIMSNADRKVTLHSVSGWIGLGALLFAASGVFGQLQLALNHIFGVEPKPGAGIKTWLRKRLLSFGFVGVLAFLSAVSLIASTLLRVTDVFGDDTFVLRIVHAAVSVVMFTLIFAAVLKLLPDVALRWRTVFGGAFVTAVLFSAGKYAIGLYLAKKGVGSDYGPAGSAIVLLVWVYFSGAILFIGAEITKAWIQVSGRRIRPNAFAVLTDTHKADTQQAQPEESGAGLKSE